MLLYFRRVIKRYFPNLSVLLSYPSGVWKGDLSAGLTVGVMLIPQGMAYAMIAGLPPVYGLYAAFVPQIVYALLGSSRQLAVGPVAMDSLLVAAGLSVLPNLSPEKYISLALVLALYVGGIQFVLGQLKLGFFVHFMSKPVISGFTSAAALIIGLSQANHLLGIDLPRTNQLHTLFWALIELGASAHATTLAIGLAGILLLGLLKKYLPKLPAALFLVAAGVLLSERLQWESYGVKVVGIVPGGLPSLHIPQVDLDTVVGLTPLALTIALIAFMEAIAIAKAVDEKNNTSHVQPNQELIALGAANMLGAFFQSYPTTGGFSRTAVNNQSGAQTSLAALLSAGVVALTLLFFTRHFYHLPNALLASIIMVAVFNLIDWSYPVLLWKTNRQEAFILFFTFLTTLFVGFTQGILLGVLVALVHLIYRTSSPHIAVLGQIQQTPYFKNITRFPTETVTRPGTLIVRFDGPLFFGNQAYFRSELTALLTQQKERVSHLVIDAGPIHLVDATALQMLQTWIKELEEEQIDLYWVQLTGPLRDLFEQNGLTKQMGQQHFFGSLAACIHYLTKQEVSALEQKIATQTNTQEK